MWVNTISSALPAIDKSFQDCSASLEINTVKNVFHYRLDFVKDTGVEYICTHTTEEATYGRQSRNELHSETVPVCSPISIPAMIVAYASNPRIRRIG